MLSTVENVPSFQNRNGCLAIVDEALQDYREELL